MIVLYEHYRPSVEGDQMLVMFKNIDFVKAPIMLDKPDFMVKVMFNTLVDITGNTHKLVFPTMDINKIYNIINDYVYFFEVPQPCNISIYSLITSNVVNIPPAFRGVIDAETK